MKRTFLMLIALIPSLAFGRDYTEMDSLTAGSIILFLIGIGLCIVIFLFFRQLFLWYWKVDVIVKNQIEHTQLLKSIYNSIEENNRLTQSQIELVIGKDNDTI